MVLNSFRRNVFIVQTLFYTLLMSYWFCSWKSQRGGKRDSRHFCRVILRLPYKQDKNWRMAGNRAHLRFIFMISIHGNWSHVLKVNLIWLQQKLFFLCRYWNGKKNVLWNSQPVWPSWWLPCLCQTWQIPECCPISNHSCCGMLKDLYILIQSINS